MLFRQCFFATTKVPKPIEKPPLTDLDTREETSTSRGEPAEQLVSMPLEDDPSRTVQIGSMMTPDVRKKLINLLRANADVFAWTTADMPGIPEEIIIHKLKVDPHHRPVK